MHDKHNLLVEFLRMIGVKEEIANRDAEGIEHHLGTRRRSKAYGFVRTAKKVRPR